MSKKLISLAFARAAQLKQRIWHGETARGYVAILVLVGLVALPLSVQALGFGGIKLNSALNEPLDAEIDLLSATAADVEGLDVKVADRSAFDRAGVDRPSFLNQIKFEIERRPAGTYLIRMRTRQPVREPFMNFLLEMNWPNGRILREYTVLLDPPDLFRRQPTVVEAPETQPPAEISRVPAPLAPEPMAVPEPELAPEPSAEVVAEPELAPAPVGEPIPEPLPEPAPVAIEEPIPMPEPEVQVMEEPTPVAEAPAAMEEPFAEEQLFPLIPLTDYREPKESDYAARAAEEPMVEMAEPSPMEEPVEEPAVEPVAGELDYGLTRKGDNLWKIAEQLRQDDTVTLYQVMMALLQSNPDAFVDGNVHRLKVGRVMRISDPSLLTAMSARDAAAEYRRQTAAWTEYRQSVAQIDTTAQPLVAVEPEEAAPAEVVSAAEPGELTVEPPGGAPSAGAGVQEQADAQSAALLALRDEVNQAIEQVRSDPNASPEQQARLSALTEELERLERMVTVEDEQLAALQTELSKIGEAQEVPAVEEPAPAEVAPEVVMAEEEPVAEPAEEPMAAEPVMEEAVVEESAVEAVEAETGAVAEAEVLPVTEGEEAAPVAEIEPEPEPVAAAEPEPVTPPVAEAPAPAVEEPGMVGKLMGWLGAIGGFFAALAGSPLMIAAVGTGVVVLLLGFVLWRRRRASAEGGESILTGEAAALPVEEAAAAASGPVSEESSFLSDFAISGMNAIQAEDSEVDPITEADVFMAYGRYEAAEERLKDAIRNEPARKELKLKLIELYYTTKNKPQFEATAEELYAALGDQADGDAGWEKVLVMGAELAPANPLFKGAAAAGASSDVIDVGGSKPESEIMDIGLDTGIFKPQELEEKAAAADVSGSETMVTSTDDLDFNLDTSFEPTAEASEDSGLGFDLAGTPSGVEFDLESNTVDIPSAADEVTQSRESVPSEAFDLDETMAEPVKSEEFSLEQASAATSEEFDLDLGGSTKSEEFMARAGESQEFDLSELSGAPARSEEFELDLSDTTSVDLGAKADDALLDMNLEAADAVDVALSASSDEVGTKLDLAKAYIDMGDPDGARSILDEVLEEGDNSQKQEAQQLMQQIG
jgi:pilus assembly protein FimV